MTYYTVDSDVLCHHGIKGQKWGVRRFQNADGSYTAAGRERYASNYSSEQRKRDLAVYGKRGVSRINKQMLKGDPISAARSREATRIHRTRETAKIAGQVGSTVGAVIGGVGGFIGGQKAAKWIQTKVDVPAAAALAASSTIAAGAASVGKTLGRRGGQSLAMVLGGYDPAKYRS